MLYLYTFTKDFSSFHEAVCDVLHTCSNLWSSKLYWLRELDTKGEVKNECHLIKQAGFREFKDGSWQLSYTTASTKVRITVGKIVTAEVRVESDKWNRRSSAVKDFNAHGWTAMSTEIAPNGTKAKKTPEPMTRDKFLQFYGTNDVHPAACIVKH